MNVSPTSLRDTFHIKFTCLMCKVLGHTDHRPHRTIFSGPRYAWAALQAAVSSYASWWSSGLGDCRFSSSCGVHVYFVARHQTVPTCPFVPSYAGKSIRMRWRGQPNSTSFHSSVYHRRGSSTFGPPQSEFEKGQFFFCKKEGSPIRWLLLITCEF